MTDTIFALSSGQPPAALAVIRVSGPDASTALKGIAGSLPAPRQASLRTLRDREGTELDRALVLWFPGPATATGDDLAELHLHGGRAVVAAVEHALASYPGLRRAGPGEFTRRAFVNGRIDLAEAEGLADLLAAETELQRRQALALASGGLSAQVNGWRDDVLRAGAQVEALLDFGDEEDVQSPVEFRSELSRLQRELAQALAAPSAEALREGYRVVLAGPPNAGKSSLFNRLVEEEAAITNPLAGTTRDVLSRPVALGGIPFVFVDTAGLRECTSDQIEAIGIERARGELARGDLILWLGPEGEGGEGHVWEVESFSDQGGGKKLRPRHSVSALSGDGLAGLRDDLIQTACGAMPGPNSVALNKRQHLLLSEAHYALAEATASTDILITAEALRVARSAFDRLLGRAATEDMLDALFGRFCIGK